MTKKMPTAIEPPFIAGQQRQWFVFATADQRVAMGEQHQSSGEEAQEIEVVFPGVKGTGGMHGLLLTVGSGWKLECTGVQCRYCRIGRRRRPDHPFVCLPAGSTREARKPQRSPDQPPLSGPVSKCSRGNRRAVAVAIDQLGWRAVDELFTVYINSIWPRT